MKWLLLVVAVLAVLLFLPLYLYVCYDGEFRLLVRILFFRFELYLGDITSNSKKRKTKKKSKQTKRSPDKTKPVKTNGYSFAEQISDLLNSIKLIHVIIVRAFTVKKIRISVKVATGDPCDTAILFGTVNGILCAFMAYVESIIPVKKKEISVTADYNTEQTEVYFYSVNKTNVLKLVISLIKAAANGTIKTDDKGE